MVSRAVFLTTPDLEAGPALKLRLALKTMLFNFFTLSS